MVKTLLYLSYRKFFSGYNLDIWIRSSCPLKAKKGVYKKSLPQCSDNSLFYCVLRLASSSEFDLVSCPFYGSSRTKPMWDWIFSEFAIIFLIFYMSCLSGLTELPNSTLSTHLWHHLWHHQFLDSPLFSFTRPWKSRASGQ